MNRGRGSTFLLLIKLIEFDYFVAVSFFFRVPFEHRRLLILYRKKKRIVEIWVEEGWDVQSIEPANLLVKFNTLVKKITSNSTL